MATLKAPGLQRAWLPCKGAGVQGLRAGGGEAGSELVPLWLF